MTEFFWSLEPFLNPVQVRLLLALRDGPKTQGELAAILHRDVRNIRKHMVKPHRWGLVGYSPMKKLWQLQRPWPDTIASLRQIVESHLNGIQSAISDLAEAPSMNLSAPAKDHKADLLSYVREVRKHGP